MHRVLLVDSDKAVRDALLGAFAGRYELLYAKTGSRGLDLARKTRPVLAILECLLRDVSGLELLRRLKAALPGLPVVMIAPYDCDWIRATVLHAGASQYFTKPIDISALQLLIEDCLLTGPGQPRTGGAAAADRVLVTQAAVFIDEHYAEPLTLSSLASRLGRSKFELCRKFTIVQGVSFREYLVQVRLTKARELLATRRHSITEIAQMVGFGDLPRFDKVFKRATGTAPSTYRIRLATPVGKFLAARAG